MLVRGLIVLALAGLLAFHAVRTAAVRDTPGSWGAVLWPAHPRVQLRQAMAEIGTRAAHRDTLTPELLHRVERIAVKAPLAPEPFLIRAAVAQLEGRDGEAERLFLIARGRDPRSRAARYFLADRYLRTGRTAEALTEMAVLSRLLEGVSAPFAPALANYAQTRGAVPVLRRFFAANPDFEAPVLFELSRSPGNTDLILALWSGPSGTQAAGPAWQGALVQQLVASGDFARAHLVWSTISGVDPPVGRIFNTEFRELQAPAPFNWTFPNVGGVAEPSGNGRLQVLYFGRQDTTLAEQLLLLGPGRYQLAMEVTGGTSEQSNVAWSLSCVPGGQALAELPLGRGSARRTLEAKFVVPRGCRAQRLQLAASAGEFARSVEFTIARLQLAGPGS